LKGGQKKGGSPYPIGGGPHPKTEGRHDEKRGENRRDWKKGWEQKKGRGGQHNERVVKPKGMKKERGEHKKRRQ